MNPPDYYQLKKKEDKLFHKWWKCEDNKVAKLLYDEYIKTIREASAIAPHPDEVWRQL